MPVSLRILWTDGRWVLLAEHEPGADDIEEFLYHKVRLCRLFGGANGHSLECARLGSWGARVDRVEPIIAPALTFKRYLMWAGMRANGNEQ